MKNIFVLVFLFAFISNGFSQTEKFDIATFTPPAGWQRIDSNGAVLFHDYKTVNSGTAFCQLFLFPSHVSTGDATKDFKAEWDNRVVRTTRTTAKPVTQTEKTPDGWTVVTGYTNITQQGVTYTCMLVTVTGFGKEMTSLVNLAGQDYLAAVNDFFTSLDLDKNASVAANDSQNTQPTNNTNASGISINDYQFIAPEGWFMQKNNQFVILSQLQNPQSGCIISVSLPQPSSGDLEKDVKGIFNQLYSGWQFRYTLAEKHDELAKGFTPQGFEYCRLKASMQKLRPDGYYYDYEDGDVMVVKVNKQIIVVVSRHNRGEMVCFCDYRYDYWPRFFNTFMVKNVAALSHNDELSQRIIGSWKSMQGSALINYIFAGNGHYQFVGAYSTTSQVSWNTIELKTSGFKGDGTYSIKGNKVTTMKYGGSPETIQVRLEKVNFGSTGWKDRLYILELIDGKENEVSLEKELHY